MDDDDLGWLSLGAQQPEWDVVSSNPNYTYADEYDKGYGGAYQTGDNAISPGGEELYPGWTGTGLTGFINSLNRAGGAQKLLGQGLDLASSKGGIAALMALLSAFDRQKPSGGGVAQAYAGPKPITRTMTQGAYGPIARYAAEGGLMQAYAQGGKVQMEDGGFVMTKRAVDGAGGPRGIQQLVPGATMIRGPGTGTSDDIPAVINGRNGQTPARLSNGEAYVPKPFVDRLGGARQMYALMNNLQRRA
jgi:hypothetical protein